MKIAFELNCIIKRELEIEISIIIGFIKVLKCAGHSIILWSECEPSITAIFIKEHKLTGYIDIIASKLSLNEECIPDIAFDCDEGEISRIVTISI